MDKDNEGKGDTPGPRGAVKATMSANNTFTDY